MTPCSATFDCVESCRVKRKTRMKRFRRKRFMSQTPITNRETCMWFVLRSLKLLFVVRSFDHIFCAAQNSTICVLQFFFQLKKEQKNTRKLLCTSAHIIHDCYFVRILFLFRFASPFYGIDVRVRRLCSEQTITFGSISEGNFFLFGTRFVIIINIVVVRIFSVCFA